MGTAHSLLVNLCINDLPGSRFIFQLPDSSRQSSSVTGEATIGA